MIAFIFLLLVMGWIAVASDNDILRETCRISLKIFVACVIILGACLLSHLAIISIAYIVKKGVVS